MKIWRTYTLEAAHQLPLVPDGHKCGRMHGHNFKIRVEVQSAVLRNGWVCDFDTIDTIVHAVIDPLDHNCLNDTISNPTSENFANYIWDKLRGGSGEYALPLALPEFAEWFAVEVSENDSSGARVERE